MLDVEAIKIEYNRKLELERKEEEEHKRKIENSIIILDSDSESPKHSMGILQQNKISIDLAEIFLNNDEKLKQTTSNSQLIDNLTHDVTFTQEIGNA